MNGAGFVSKHAGGYRTRVVADGGDGGGGGGGDVGGVGGGSHSSDVVGSVPYTPTATGTASTKAWDPLASLLFMLILSPVLVIGAISIISQWIFGYFDSPFKLIGDFARWIAGAFG